MSELTVNNASLPTDRTPVLIAAEINSIKQQTKNMVLYNSIEIGRRLVEAKSMLEHGEWGKWLESSVDYSQSTANNLMRIFDEYGAFQISIFGDNAKSQALGNLSYTQAVALLGVPADEREQFVDEHDLDKMSTRELQKAIREKLEALIEKEQALQKLESFKKLADDKSEEARILREEKDKAESENRLTDRVLRETQADVKRLQDTLEKERDNSKAEIKKLETVISVTKKQLTAAHASGNSEEVQMLEESLKEAERDLAESAKRIDELEQQLKEKPIKAAAATVIEKVPEEVEKELAELRKKAQSQNSTAKLKYSVFFETLVQGFKNLLGTLAEIKETDPEEYDRYKNAVTGLIGKMSERL